jgi:hypothetical protein
MQLRPSVRCFSATAEPERAERKVEDKAEEETQKFHQAYMNQHIIYVPKRPL